MIGKIGINGEIVNIGNVGNIFKIIKIGSNDKISMQAN